MTTVRELIAELATKDQDALVVTTDHDGDLCVGVSIEENEVDERQLVGPHRIEPWWQWSGNSYDPSCVKVIQTRKAVVIQ